MPEVLTPGFELLRRLTASLSERVYGRRLVAPADIDRALKAMRMKKHRTNPKSLLNLRYRRQVRNS